LKVTTAEKSAVCDGIFLCSADHASETEILMFRCLRVEWLAWEVSNKKLHGFSPQANYTDRVTATCRRS
jgi:hypothetical protein